MQLLLLRLLERRLLLLVRLRELLLQELVQAACGVKVQAS